MESKAKLFQKIVNEARTEHRLMTVALSKKLQKYEKFFCGKRFSFKNPRVKNRTYKVRGLEFNKFSIIPTKFRSQKSTDFIGLRNNASFFGYALSDIQLDYVKMQKSGYDKQLLEIEYKLHTEFSDKTHNIINSTFAMLLNHKMLDVDADFYIASCGYKTADLKFESLHQGRMRGLQYNSSLNEIDILVESNTQGNQSINNSEHIINIWS